MIVKEKRTADSRGFTRIELADRQKSAEIGLLKKLSEATFELREVAVEGKKVALSQGFADALRYAIMGLYLFVTTVLTTGIVSAGAVLVQPSVHRVAARLERKIEGVKGKVEELDKAIGEKPKGQ